MAGAKKMIKIEQVASPARRHHDQRETLIGLKLGGVISWPWSMALLPLWFTLGVLFIIGLGIATAVIGERVSQYVLDRRSGEPAALLVPARREPKLDRRQPA